MKNLISISILFFAFAISIPTFAQKNFSNFSSNVNLIQKNCGDLGVTSITPSLYRKTGIGTGRVKFKVTMKNYGKKAYKGKAVLVLYSVIGSRRTEIGRRTISSFAPGRSYDMVVYKTITSIEFPPSYEAVIQIDKGGNDCNRANNSKKISGHVVNDLF